MIDYVLVFIGVMFGVQGAASTLRKFADVFAKQVSKKLAQQALTKGTIYPIVKKSCYQCGHPYDKADFCGYCSICSAGCRRRYFQRHYICGFQTWLYEIEKKSYVV